jgi:hypothetical protein
VECSAKTKYNISSVFEAGARAWLNRVFYFDWLLYYILFQDQSSGTTASKEGDSCEIF